MKYRSKVITTAHQWNGIDDIESLTAIHNQWGKEKFVLNVFKKLLLYRYKGFDLSVKPGEWICQHGDAEMLVALPDEIFKLLYQKSHADKIIFYQDGDDHFQVYFDNRVYIGDFYKEVDGYYVFMPDRKGGGSWESWTMRAISDKLDELNENWDKEIKRVFSQPATYAECTKQPPKEIKLSEIQDTCPTCGVEVTIGGNDGETRYFIPRSISKSDLDSMQLSVMKIEYYLKQFPDNSPIKEHLEWISETLTKVGAKSKENIMKVISPPVEDKRNGDTC